MQITEVEVVGLRVPSNGARPEWGEDAVLVRIHTDAGLVGIGETDSSPEVVRATIEAPYSHATCQGLREVLIGQDPLDISGLWTRMYDATSYVGRRGAGIHALSAIDIALWDIAGAHHGVPVYELLGGPSRDTVPAYATFIPGQGPAASATRAAQLVQAGFGAVKIGGADFGHDLDADERTVEAVRGAIGPDVGLMLDLVGRWGNAAQASRAIERLRPYDLTWVEEPVPPDDLAAYRELSQASPVPIAGGEALTTRHELDAFMAAARPAIVQPDITRCGGITEAMRVATLAAGRGIDMVPHGFSTGILNAATIHVLVATARASLMEMSRSTSPLFTDLVVDPVTVDDTGQVRPPAGPGLGITLDDDVLERYRIF